MKGYPMTKYTKKWVCPRYMYDGKYYPQILSGSGYVMTRAVAKCLYKASLMLPYLHLEDVLVTGKNHYSLLGTLLFHKYLLFNLSYCFSIANL